MREIVDRPTTANLLRSSRIIMLATALAIFSSSNAEGLDFVDELLIYREDYEAEVAYPATPEVDEIGAGGLDAASDVPGSGPVLTGSAAHARVSLSSPFITFQSSGFFGSTIGAESLGLRSEIEFTQVDNSAAAIAHVGAVFAAGQPLDVGVDFVVGVSRNAAGVPSAFFQTFETDGNGGTAGSTGINLSIAETNALVSGTPARVDGFIDRDLGTATGTLEISGFPIRTVGPLGLSFVVGPAINLAGAGQGLFANTGVAGAIEVDFESFEIFRALASTFTVDTIADDLDADPGNSLCETSLGECSLRAAIQEANASAGIDEIILPAGNYLLSRVGTGEDLAVTGDLDILEGLILRGADRDTTVIDAGGIDRVFEIPIGAQGILVHLEDIEITGGAATAAGGDTGGGVTSWADLTLERCFVSNNQASLGGGIMNFQSIVVEDCVVSGNAAVVVDSVNPHAGGIRSAVPGGFDPAKNVTIRKSAVINNSAFVAGGVELENTESLLIENSTISGNADVQLSIVNTNAVLRHATIVGGANPGMAAMRNSANPQTLEFLNSAIDGTPACNVGPFFPITVLFSEANASNDLTCAFGSATGSSEGVPLEIGPLSLLLGHSPAHLPYLGSPLIDIADPVFCPSVDQVGTARPVDGDSGGTAECDIGAVELPEPGFALTLAIGTAGFACASRRRGLAVE